MDVIRTESLVKAYYPNFTLGPIDIGLKPGEILAVIGPKGSGKTTLLRILWGFVRPETGNVKVFARTPHLHQVSVRLRAGYLSEAPVFYPWMTPRRFLKFISTFYENWDEGYADQLLSDFNIDDRRIISQLSKSSTTKLGLIAAAGHRPALLLLDEPMRDLDPVVCHEISLLLKDLSREQNVGIVVSSPVLEDLKRIADTVLMLNYGRVAEYGSISETCSGHHV